LLGHGDYHFEDRPKLICVLKHHDNLQNNETGETTRHPIETVFFVVGIEHHLQRENVEWVVIVNHHLKQSRVEPVCLFVLLKYGQKVSTVPKDRDVDVCEVAPAEVAAR